ncbi:ribonuclease E activity regulator RraA [Maricaulaceae bacterium MS644]
MISVCDLCDAHPDRVQVLEPVFSSYGGRDAFFGRAETITAHEDNSRVRDAVNEPGDGRVLVVNGGGSLKRSLLGGDLAGKAARNGWSGVIVYGAVRDIAELEAEPLGVLALALIPMKTEKRGLGVRGGAVCIAGAVVNPGDWIYVDRDGAIVAAEPLHET